MAKCLSSLVSGFSTSKIVPHYPRRLYRNIHVRGLSTFKTANDRVLSITHGTAAAASKCACDIQFPEGLEIDRSRPLINTVANYNQHVVIATGKDDWESRIENEDGVGDMARTLKDITKVKGERFDVYPLSDPELKRLLE